MKKLFYFSLLGLLLFEILNVYFIMPFPGSQDINSIDAAYFLYSFRWFFRIIFICGIILGSLSVFKVKRKLLPLLLVIVVLGIIYLLNFKFSAEKMFLPVKNLKLKTQSENTIPEDQLVIGISHNGEAKAYPIEFLAYHHQIYDQVGGKNILLTYCSVCRTGRAYVPIVKGCQTTFRLVGMDHYNALFEDRETGSWWRQSTGEAITGPLKGEFLEEIESRQLSLKKWFELYPNGRVMQPDPNFLMTYDKTLKFEQGKSQNKLTRTDQKAWSDKSWIVGIRVGDAYKAYDWNGLKKKGIIHDTINKKSIILIVSSNGKDFAAFERSKNQIFSLQNNTITSGPINYNFSGKSLNSASIQLKSIPVYQEFWHSWSTFHPTTLQYLRIKN